MATTSNKNYPLIDPQATIADDHPKLNQAMSMIDADVAELESDVAARSPIGHNHTITDVTGLQSALDDKAADGHSHNLGDLGDVDASGAATNMVLSYQVNGWQPVAMDASYIVQGTLNTARLPAYLQQAALDNRYYLASGANVNADTLDGLHASDLVQAQGGAGDNLRLGKYQYLSDYDDGTAASTGIRAYVRDGIWHINPNTGEASALGIHIDGNEVWHAGNDGDGSGLDADLLDGVQASEFAQLDVDNEFTRDLTISRHGPNLVLEETSSNTFARFRILAGVAYLRIGEAGAGDDGGGELYICGTGAADNIQNFKVRHSNAWQDVWHGGNCAASLGSSGYQKLASGLILQWGYAASNAATPITFPIAFPTACRSVVATLGNDTNDGNESPRVKSLTTTGFMLNPVESMSCYWQAIGY